jgi:CheY-like chemotaxis protein
MIVSPNILYIEDEPLMLDMVKQILRASGYPCQLKGTTSAAEGLEIMRERKTDVVLLDLTMPNTNGWDVYRQMKQDETLAEIPVIVISATIPERDKHIAEDLPPVDDYITKPFDVNRLLRSVRQVMEDNDL